MRCVAPIGNAYREIICVHMISRLPDLDACGIRTSVLPGSPDRPGWKVVSHVSVPERLGFGFTFDDLRGRDGLIRLDKQFLEGLATQDASAASSALLAARAAPDSLAHRDESDLVVALGPHLDGFVAALFGIEAETAALTQETLALDPIHACKRLFVQRQAVKKYADPAGPSTALPSAPRSKPASPPPSPNAPSPSTSQPPRTTRRPWTKRCATPPGPP